MKCCRPTKDHFVKWLGWTQLNHTVIDSSLCVSTTALFVYRAFVFLFCMFTYTSHFIHYDSGSIEASVSWFRYLTHWDAINMGIYFGLASVFTLLAEKDPARSLAPLSSSKLACFVHFMFELTFLSAWFVSLLYWIALYPIQKEHPKDYFAFLDACMHGLPALWITIDLFIGAGVLVHFHLWLMYAYFLVYLVVNAVVVVVSAQAIYAILDFETITTLLWIVISLFLVAFLWFLAYLCVRLRSRCCTRRRTPSVVVFSKDAKPPADPLV